MDYTAIIAQMDEQRARWHDLPDMPGKRLRLLRPLETDVDKLGGTSLHRLADALAEFVTDWAGFTEADLVGASQGSDAVIPFDRRLFARWMRDRLEVTTFVGEQVHAAIQAHRAEREQARKN